ncbi:M15 family metallopeptidase [Paenibacillus tianjinensis]|uniref:M15 family metallopeptidase n=1 Tax=Paenibacillus tianjinensis TaxID=2810347 RepID=A0ABX7LAU2_9BACL|nr:M15 family metallopeptidase [Paenibacillus tianjinensis]QSF43570.1 M15 family metallopeptidase [Paenibacillus tianjinensis]
MLTLEQVMNKSTSKIAGLHPILQEATKVLIENCYRKGICIQVTQGLRTIAEQDALYAQGRTKPGNIVTNAKGGTSYHNFGVAIDFVLILPDGKNVTWDLKTDFNSNNVKDWTEVVDEAKKLGFEWGGDWTSFKDYPHFQMIFGLKTSQFRSGKTPTQKQVNDALALINKYRYVAPVVTPPQPTVKDDDQVDKVKIVYTKDNSLVDGFMKDNKNYVSVEDLKRLGLIKASWDNINKKLYIN